MLNTGPGAACESAPAAEPSIWQPSLARLLEMSSRNGKRRRVTVRRPLIWFR